MPEKSSGDAAGAAGLAGVESFGEGETVCALPAMGETRREATMTVRERRLVDRIDNFVRGAGSLNPRRSPTMTQFCIEILHVSATDV